MAEIIGVVVVVLGLLVSIALHEVGHMVPAKRFGVRVSEYFVGFGPTVWSRRGTETEYGLKAIPLGGYVRMVGMIPPAEAVKPVRSGGWVGRLIADTRDASVEEIREGEDHRAFYRLAWWKKVIVMTGGPLMNLLIAVVLFTAVFAGIGTPGQSLTVREVVPCVPAALSEPCTAADPASPASQAGLQAGDTFVAVDDQSVTTWEELTAYIGARPGETVDVEVLRDGESVTLSLTPAAIERQAYDEDGVPVVDAAGEPVMETAGYMGVYSETVLQRQGVLAGAQVTGDYLGQMVGVVATLPEHLWHATRAALGLEERSQDGVIGVVGIGRIAAESAGADIEGYGFTEKTADALLLLGGLNLALFVFNMIPLVPLDGGHVASALWQAIKNGWARVRGAATPRPVDVARMMPLAYGVFGVLLLMGAVLIVADIVAPVTVA